MQKLSQNNRFQTFIDSDHREVKLPSSSELAELVWLY